jgi:hypothetical protein
MERTAHTFLGRHATLLRDPDATLPCCYHRQGQQVCEATATHTVQYDYRGGRRVVSGTALPLLYEGTVRSDGGRRHPEFCAAHAQIVCASTGDAVLRTDAAGEA